MKKMKSNDLTDRQTLLYSIIFATSCLALHCITKKLYANVDNYTISIVTNRLYDADNYCVYLHPILCWIIGMISNIFPQADAFALLGRALIWGAFVWLFYTVMKSQQKSSDKILEALFLLFISIALNIWNENYTVQAAFFMFTGLVTLFGVERKKRFGLLDICIGTAFMCIGVMWRIQAALLFIPFVLLEIVAGRICTEESGTDYWKNVKKAFGSVFLLFLILVVSRSAVQMSEEYNSSVAYDSARVKVQDYPMKDWEVVENELVGISRSEYDSAKSWILLDTETIDKDFLLKIADVGETTEFDWNIHGLVKGFKMMALTVWRSSKAVWIFLSVFLSVFLYAFLANQSWWRKLECVLACAGAGIIILYYIMVGRAPLRVWESVIFAAMGVLVINKLSADEQVVDKRFFIVLKVIVGLLLCVGIFRDVVTAEFSAPQLAINSRSHVDEALYEETFEEEALYFWESWHANITQYYMKQGKLPSEELLRHNLSVGDWTYGQVYFVNHLEEVNAENPAKALVDRNDTYL